MTGSVDAAARLAATALGRAGKATCFAIRIDGRCGSGKTTLAGRLAALLPEAQVIAMDDFFLPMPERTPERKAQPGWNTHYERFNREVAAPFAAGEQIRYGVYDCHAGRMTRTVVVPPCRFLIVEGSYALHPAILPFGDLSVFVTVSPDEQMRRITARQPRLAKRFAEEWIPLEEAYFSAFRIAENADFLIEN